VVGPHFGAGVCQLGLIFADSAVVMGMFYTLTLTKPKGVLLPVRPTSSLLGPTTLGSIFGIEIIHTIGLVIAYRAIFDHPDYVPFPTAYTNAGQYYYTADNWETTVLFCSFIGQLTASALTFSFGGKIRQSLQSNWPVLIAFCINYGLMTLAMLTNESPLSHAFHIASHQDNGPHPDNPIWLEYQRDGNPTSPPMGFAVRLTIWSILACSSLLAAGWEKGVIHGVGARYFQQIHPSLRPKLST